MPHTTHPFDHTAQVAHEWLAEVAAEFDTDDSSFVYRVTRAWLHAVRDRLPVIEVAHLGAQLPELLRGVYYDGWTPSTTPKRMHVDEFVARYADDAGVARAEVPKVLWAVSNALDRRLSNLPKVLDCVPSDIRILLRPSD
jgi:uncharacterized protein (DUF2267 family)